MKYLNIAVKRLSALLQTKDQKLPRTLKYDSSLNIHHLVQSISYFILQIVG